MKTAPVRRILTWHIHGSYLQLLGHMRHQVLVPVRDGRPPRHGGLPPGRMWPPNLVEVDADDVPNTDIDCVLYQSDENWLDDRHRILSEEQQRLPAVYLEHDPPGHDGVSCFAARHPLDDPAVEIVHVTHFNDLMWDSGQSPTTVIEHAVADRGHLYTGELERGLVVVNNLGRRGRRLGLDVFARVRKEIPLDLIGMDSLRVDGLGEVPPDEMAAFAARYRFFFHPIRYTSLGLALCEAMMSGLPIVSLATTEAVTVVEDGVSGFIDTDVTRLVTGMQDLLANPDGAMSMGVAARKTAETRFSLPRFVDEWERLIDRITA